MEWTGWTHEIHSATDCDAVILLHEGSGCSFHVNELVQVLEFRMHDSDVGMLPEKFYAFCIVNWSIYTNLNIPFSLIMSIRETI